MTSSPLPVLTPKDFQSDQDVRWCPGCGDYAILNQTLQVTYRPDFVIKEMLRVGRKGIVSFPNFAHILTRSQLFFKGRMPVHRLLPHQWYETPNIHLLTIKDFRVFCRENDITILQEYCLISSRSMARITGKLAANLLAQEGIFVIARKSG